MNFSDQKQLSFSLFGEFVHFVDGRALRHFFFFFHFQSVDLCTDLRKKSVSCNPKFPYVPLYGVCCCWYCRNLIVIFVSFSLFECYSTYFISSCMDAGIHRSNRYVHTFHFISVVFVEMPTAIHWSLVELSIAPYFFG